jgi:hypothetical protein
LKLLRAIAEFGWVYLIPVMVVLNAIQLPMTWWLLIVLGAVAIVLLALLCAAMVLLPRAVFWLIRRPTAPSEPGV